MNDSALSLLGLCRKAGKLSLGHDACKASLNSGNASLCVICSDASARLNEEITSLAQKAEVIIVDVSYTVDDEGFAKTLIKKFNENKSGKERGL